MIETGRSGGVSNHHLGVNSPRRCDVIPVFVGRVLEGVTFTRLTVWLWDHDCWRSCKGVDLDQSLGCAQVLGSRDDLGQLLGAVLLVKRRSRARKWLELLKVVV